jgi:hypothetical protein
MINSPGCALRVGLDGAVVLSGEGVAAGDISEDVLGELKGGEVGEGVGSELAEGPPVMAFWRPCLRLSHPRKMANATRNARAITRAFVRCLCAHFMTTPGYDSLRKESPLSEESQPLFCPYEAREGGQSITGR